MGASSPDGTGPTWLVSTLRAAAGVALALLASTPLSAQVEAAPELRGQAWLNEAPLERGMVILHHLNNEMQGEIDSIEVGSEGLFTLGLPNVPDPSRGDVFFASVRHGGVLYFGPFITQGVQLDSLYRIEAYDTVAAPIDGEALEIERATFLEPSSGGWQVTDVFAVLNDGNRTLVPRDGGRVWSYPLPEGTTDFATGPSDAGADAVTFEDGDVVLRAPLPPGQRQVAVRYLLAEAFPEIPTPGEISFYQLFVREPAPEIEVEGLLPGERLEIEAGTTYRSFSAEALAQPSLVIEAAAGTRPPPVEWMAVALALALAGFGVFTMRRVGAPAGAVQEVETSGTDARTAVLLEIARLDEAYEAQVDPSAEARAAYDEARARLLRRARQS